MPWNVFAVVDATDDDDALYPILSGPESPIPVELTELDGSSPLVYSAKVARVLGHDARGKFGKISRLPTDIAWDVLVTDSRLIAYCEKYDKGGGWTGFGIGGLAVAVAANAVSKARAAYRRKGKVLVGHIRYPWIERVLVTQKSGWGTSSRLRLQVNAEPSAATARYICLELELPKHVDALGMGHEVARRAAWHRLHADTSMDAAERAAFNEIVNSPVRQMEPPDGPKDIAWASYVMPTSFRVNTRTARLGNGSDVVDEQPTTSASVPVADDSVTQVEPDDSHEESEPQWAIDPYGRYELRYFDGQQWTAHVSTQGIQSADPIPSGS